MPDASTPAGTFLGDTEGTVLGPARRGPSSSCESASVARRWTEALHELKARRAERIEQAAVALLVRQPGTNGRLRTRLRFLDRRSVEPLALVLGRHPCCDLPGIRDASLRHAVVLAWPRSRQPLEVVDLRSSTGLVLSSGRRVRRLCAASSLRFGAGSDEVTVLYAAPGAPFEIELPDELDEWLEIEQRVALGELSFGGAEDGISQVSFVRRVGGSFQRQLDGRALALAGHEVVPVSSWELREGLLLGRYARCDRSAMFTGDESVSRVHALVFQRGGRLHVVDAGSSNGTVIVDARERRKLGRLSERCRVRTLEPWETIRVGKRQVAFEIVPHGVAVH